MKKGLFVTATSTGIGKTVFSAIFCIILAKAGYKTAYYKPIQSGAVLKNSERLAPDCLFVGNVLQPFPSCAVHYTYLLNKPASPHFAARLEGVTLSLNTIQQDYRGLAESYDYIIVEGAGGLYVPVDDAGTLVTDIPLRLGINTVLISDAGLGTINHTALSFTFARQKGINLRAILLVSTNRVHTDIELENQAVLKKITGLEEVYLIPGAGQVDVERNHPGNLLQNALLLAEQFRPLDWINA